MPQLDGTGPDGRPLSTRSKKEKRKYKSPESSHPEAEKESPYLQNSKKGGKKGKGVKPVAFPDMDSKKESSPYI